MFVFSSGIFAQERFVRPVDEAKLDPSFYAFRSNLIAATERRDAKHILSILDPKIELSFGGHAGVKDFREMWKIDKPKSEFWSKFLPVIKNGGSFVRNNGKRTNLFFAPYTFESFPDDLDAFEHAVIFGAKVDLRDRPDANAAVVGSLSYNVVKLEEDPSLKSDQESADVGWKKVVTLGGLRGFVRGDYVRSPIDYRAGFEKKRGLWKMVAFIAGD